MKVSKSVSLVARAAVATLIALASAGAMAADGTDAGIDAINELSTKAAAYVSAAFGVAVLVAGGFWGIKMMKKAFSAAK